MKKTLKGFIAGVIVSTLVVSTAIAGGALQTIQVAINSVNVKVNGSKVDANNIVYKGSTYVPIRAVGEMLNKEVVWNGETRTATINDINNNFAETTSQKNAIKKAKNHLEYGAFSRISLIEQLKSDKYSEADAIYAVDKLDIDWRIQAAKKARAYTSFTSFTKSALMSQLTNDGFTIQEVNYAVNQVEI